MRAKRVQHGQLTGLGTPDDQVSAEVVEGFDLTGLDLVGGGDLKPAIGNRRGEIALALLHRSLKIERVSLFSSRNWLVSR